MTNKNWQVLKPGDIVDVIAPSFNVPGVLEEVYAKTKAALESIGLIACIPDDLIDMGKDLFSTNSLEYRANHLVHALTNSQSKAVWALRGGYGAAKLIPFLEAIKPPSNAKLLLGFSDITALHLFLLKKWKWSCLHSPVLNQIITNKELLEPLKPILFEQKPIHYTQLMPLNKAALAPNIIEAPITGGNASLVQTSLATSWQIETEDNIIFLEDVGERGYQIDRMLNHFLQAGIFNHAKAVIFGDFSDGSEKDGTNLVPATLRNFAQSLKLPVLSFPFIGHNINCNLPLPLGIKCRLTLGDGASSLMQLP